MVRVNLAYTFRRLWLLFWKNLILRRRQYIVTAFEIVLPTLFAILMAYLRASIKSNAMVITEQYFQEKNEQDIARLFFGNFYSSRDVTIGYSPNTTTLTDFVAKIEEKIFEYVESENFTGRIPNVIWLPFENERAIEAYAGQYGVDGYEETQFYGALVFDGLKSLDPADYSKNDKISYKIRLLDKFYDTKTIMPWLAAEVWVAGNENTYHYTGFSAFQIIIDKLIAKALFHFDPGVVYKYSTEGFPYPEKDDFDFNQVYFILLPQFLVLGFIFIIPSTVRAIVSEKETGIKELMKMNGIPNWMHWFGWMMNSIVVLIFSITIVTILFFVTFNSESGAVFVKTDPTLWWFFMLFYIVWATTHCFLVSSFFNRPTLATTIGIVVWIATYYGVAIPLEPQYDDLSFTAKIFLCFCPNMALHFGIKIISSFESRGIGQQWSNIGTQVTSLDEMSLGIILLMFIVSGVLNIILALYFEKVMPTNYGIRKPWYFIFLPSEWGIGSSTKEHEDIQELRSKAEEFERGDKFESIPEGIPIGMEVLGLRKEFGPTKVAVDDVSAKAYKGQIFCLLGHNGAGKTTTMSILTGMIEPTKGTALINGMDLRYNLSSIRHNLGLCPQHNLIFAKLTVKEHLKFFGMAKGLSSSAANREVEDLIKKLNLEEKANVLSESLSGGQKRKLCLGCAIIGGSQVLFLDECSSGLDPEARRVIWDLLLELRTDDRTVILTTHFLEEADVLGDRIAIMASGKVQCCGSPMFLKKYYGTGYTLSLSLDRNNSDPNAVLSCIQSHVPSAVIKSVNESSELTELSIMIPTENNNSSSFPQMFSDLLGKKSELKIQDIGMGLTTMEEVFLKVEETSRGNHSIDGIIASDFRTSVKSTGMSKVGHQFGGLVIKKMLYSIKRWKLTAAQLIVPLLLVITAILVSNTTYSRSDKLPPLKMQLSSYKNSIVPFTGSTEELRDSFKYTVASSALEVSYSPSLNFSQFLMSKAEEDIDKYNQRYITGASLVETSPGNISLKGYYSLIPQHSCPLSINLLSNAMLRHLDSSSGAGASSGYSIEVTNHPLVSGTRSLWRSSLNQDFTEVTPYVLGVLLSIGLILMAASLVVMPIEERKCQSKQLQMMTGVSPFVYWGAAFTWDYFVVLVGIGLILMCFPILEVHDAFTNHGGTGVLFLIMAVFGVGATCLSYLLSLVAQTPAGGYALVVIANVITGTFAALAVYILESDGSDKLYNASLIVGWIGRLFPTYGVAKSAMIFARLSTGNSRCNILTDDVKAILCRESLSTGGSVISQMQACCDNCGSLPGVKCFQPSPYYDWWFQPPDDYRPTPRETPGIAQELVYTSIISLFYMCLLILVEYGILKKVMNIVASKSNVSFNTNVSDDDVAREKQRVSNLLQQGKASEEAIVVSGLSKNYGTFSAVSNITFGVHFGECFGLLGVNGAGKTTTFRMLTGDEIVSSGAAYISDKSLQVGRKDFLSQIGYCPQFDGIIGVLSGRQMLQLFARLRGIEGSKVTSETNKWLERMGLTDSGSVQCQNYSGGMKRRLSAAMALIGDPPVVFLDEPTSGVDAVSRRQFWNIIASLRDAGQAIILTSHSMEECEHLCSRLGIMVNGEMQCLGGVPHLKNKFAQGFTLSLRLSQEALTNAEGLQALATEILQRYDPCSIKDQHQNSMQFHINSTHLGWDRLFGIMEAIKIQFPLLIEEYSLQQTTLEEVFLSFARQQYAEDRVVQASVFSRILSFCTGCK